MLKLFDFKCQDCSSVFEKLIEPTDSPAVSCPKCNSVNIARTWTKSTFKVTGAGAYNNKLVY